MIESGFAEDAVESSVSERQNFTDGARQVERSTSVSSRASRPRDHRWGGLQADDAPALPVQFRGMAGLAACHIQKLPRNAARRGLKEAVLYAKQNAAGIATSRPTALNIFGFPIQVYGLQVYHSEMLSLRAGGYPVPEATADARCPFSPK